MRVTSIPFSAKYLIYLHSKVTEYFERAGNLPLL